MGARADIPDRLVAEIVELHWRMRDLADAKGDAWKRKYHLYPVDPCTTLVRMGYPYKLVRAKLTRMCDKGQLSWLLTPCVPDRRIDWSKIDADQPAVPKEVPQRASQT